ncbi:hypothetical protein JX265_005086 [Neoarthrinium moseri]|uniref:Uncharacterized protein n=1 Tax=Neoarthrinium moseri TaxID=1658444 RepID=A0A9P9WPG4_9PEZI|nr:hypothetical protein JX265_005086 [Neoarthrinium moseri]
MAGGHTIFITSERSSKEKVYKSLRTSMCVRANEQALRLNLHLGGRHIGGSDMKNLKTSSRMLRQPERSAGD